jgi:hypothetical protein
MRLQITDFHPNKSFVAEVSEKLRIQNLFPFIPILLKFVGSAGKSRYGFITVAAAATGWPAESGSATSIEPA